MNGLLVAGLMLGSTVAAPASIEHVVQIEHPGGAIDARYRADVAIEHRQVGAVGAAGRPSTLRCVWTAGVTVERHARHATGMVMTRSLSRDEVASGSRPGWCDGQRRAIATEVARRTDAIREHVTALAAEDHPTLRAEADQLHANRADG